MAVIRFRSCAPPVPGGRARRVEVLFHDRVFAVVDGRQMRALHTFGPFGPNPDRYVSIGRTEQLELLDEVLGGIPRWVLTPLAEGVERIQRWVEDPTPLPAKFRPKDTSEVAEASDDPSEDAELHGGDGSSGEVDHPAENPSAWVDCDGEEAEASAVAPAPSRCSYTPEAPSGAVARDLRRALRRLFDAMLGQASEELGDDHSSARCDGRKMVREMVSQRWDLARTHRTEVASEPRIVVAADTSGSCSASAGVTVGLCAALTKIWPELIFVEHSNGAIFRTVSRGVETHHSDPRLDTDWVGLLEREEVAGFVLFGDGDGYEHFSRVWEEAQCPVLWLDSYCAKHGLRHVPGSKWGDSASTLLSYWQGVNSSELAAQAIRAELRRKGR